MVKSKIEWTQKVWEVTGGCTKCSAGCQNCWAIKEVWRLANNPKQSDKWKGLVEKKNGVLNWTGKIKTFDDALNIPLKRKKPITYFVDSKSDLFHPRVPFEFIDDIFNVFNKCPQHIFQVLTKRIKRMAQFISAWRDYPYPENLWPGVSVCTQKEADEKIPILLQILATVRFLSIEPMLEDIWIGDCLGVSEAVMPTPFYGAKKYNKILKKQWSLPGLKDVPSLIDWVIVGAESKGRGIGRPCKAEWIDSILNQCKAANVPCFVKQIHRDGRLVKMPPEYPQEYPKD
jgi:protein gp37